MDQSGYLSKPAGNWYDWHVGIDAGLASGRVAQLAASRRVCQASR